MSVWCQSYVVSCCTDIIQMEVSYIIIIIIIMNEKISVAFSPK